MKLRNCVSGLLAAVLILSTQISAFASSSANTPNNVAPSPYKIVSSLDEAKSTLRTKSASIIVTDVEIPEIVNGDINGIIITEQDLDEALAVLNEAYNLYDYTIPNLVTSSISFSDWVPTANQPQLNAKSNITRAVSPPTRFISTRSYTKNWSGTVNYTYTDYLIHATPPGSFGNSGNFLITQARTAHHVQYVGQNGRDLGTSIAKQHGSTFHTGIGHPVNFYGVIHNRPWGKPSVNATYTIDYN